MKIQINRINLILSFILLLLLTCFSHSQTTNSTITQPIEEYSGALGLGWGVIATIIALILGICCCIFGSATIYPGLFVSIGFCLPITIFIFMVSVPVEQPGIVDLKENTAVNSYIVVKWFFLTFTLLGLLVLIIPLLNLWNNMLIPQRVDSRAQREYYEKYEKLLNQEKLKIQRESELRKKEAESNINKNEAEVLLPINKVPQSENNFNNEELQQMQGQEQNQNFENLNERDNVNSNNQNSQVIQGRKNKFLNGLRRRKENIEEISEEKID